MRYNFQILILKFFTPGFRSGARNTGERNCASNFEGAKISPWGFAAERKTPGREIAPAISKGQKKQFRRGKNLTPGVIAAERETLGREIALAISKGQKKQFRRGNRAKNLFDNYFPHISLFTHTNLYIINPRHYIAKIYIF